MKPTLLVTLALLSFGLLDAAEAGGTPGAAAVTPRIRAIVLIASAADAGQSVPGSFSGIDASRTPILPSTAAEQKLRPFLGRPLTPGAIAELIFAVRVALTASGQSFAVAYVPPQDASDGGVRVVVERAKLDGELKINGAKYFSEGAYRAAMPITAGAEIDVAALQDGVERLNRNPYRHVVLAAEPGATTGTTRLVLRTQETRPWGFTTGYNNTGTAVTDENRVFAGVTWGNAFGRGDTLGYNFSADPGLKHSLSHSGNYGTTFKSGRSLTAFGAYSTIESALPAPLTQEGTSWQAGARYGVPLAKTAGGWARSLNFAADFKYSDNNLEFAAIPVTNNVTHIAQLGATFSISRRTQESGVALSASFYGSPGGLTDRNDDTSFNASRPGAKAAYIYGRLEGQYSRALPGRFTFSTAASLQVASGALLGTEQVNGGGSAGVRGYAESSAFGDEGVLVNNELHLPAFSPFKQRDQADPFVFLDGATLRNLGPDGDTKELASAGLGLNYQFGRHFSLRAAYGWQLKELPNIAGSSSRGHISATLSF